MSMFESVHAPAPIKQPDLTRKIPLIGKRLFGDWSEKVRLWLADTKTVGDGIAILIYEQADAEAKAVDSAN